MAKIKTCVAELKKDGSTKTGLKWNCRCDGNVKKDILKWRENGKYKRGDKVSVPQCSGKAAVCGPCCEKWCLQRNFQDHPQKSASVNRGR